MRLFIAMLLPEQAREDLARLMQRLRQSRASTAQLRWTNADALHLTVKFLGECDEALCSRIVERLQRLPAAVLLPVQASDLSFLPPRKRRVLAASLTGETGPLLQLVKTCDAACEGFGFAPERRAPVPHITLARCRGGVSPAEAAGLTSAAAAIMPLPPFVPDGPWLVQSRLGRLGSRYLPLARLGG